MAYADLYFSTSRTGTLWLISVVFQVIALVALCVALRYNTIARKALDEFIKLRKVGH